MPPRFRFRALPHTADLRLRVWGTDATELIANAVAGAIRLATGHTPAGRPDSWHAIEKWPGTLPEQLVRAVNEALFLLYSRGQCALELRLSPTGAQLGAAPVPPHKGPEIEIKAATFHGLRVETTGHGLSALLVLDI